MTIAALHPIVVLWATPRSTSTAFEWMMRQRGDFRCMHEPFGEWWYEGDGAPWPRLTPQSPRRPGVTFETVREKIWKLAGEGPVFTKDFAHYVENYWSSEFLGPITHTFLIRDPAKVATSVQKRWPDVHLKELGFAELRALFDHITERDGMPPPVVDSDDLLEDPAGIVAAYCKALDVPFIEDALRWEPGAQTEDYSWYDGGSWHEKLRDSDGLKPQERGYIDIENAPLRAQELYELIKPHYDYLHQFRLKPLATDHV